MRITTFFFPLLFVACSSAPSVQEAPPESSAGSPSGAAASSRAYHELAMMDLDQMVDAVNAKIREARNGGGVAPLKEAMRMVFSRPDDDGMLDKVIGPLRAELEEQEAWEKTLSELTDESIEALAQAENVPPSAQVGHAILLQNVIAQLKPRAKEPGFERDLLIRIRDANLVLSKALKDERKLRTMKNTASPSRQAERVVGKAP